MEDINKLVDELNKLQIERTYVTRQYQRKLEISNQKEKELLVSIKRCKELKPTQDKAPTNSSGRRANKNPIQVGDQVKITNRYESGQIGTVVKSTHRMVELRDNQTGQTFRRAWWNVEKME